MGRPVLEPLWKKSTVGFGKGEAPGGEGYAAAAEWLAALYQTAVTDARGRSRPVIPPATPAVQLGLVIYANDQSVAARALTNGVAFGNRYPPGDLFWEQTRDYGLHEMARDRAGRVTLESWTDRSGSAPLADWLPHRTLCHQFRVWGEQVVYVDDAGFLPRGKGESPPEAALPGSARRTVLGESLQRTVLKEVDLQGGKLRRVFGNWQARRPVGTDFLVLGLPLVREHTWTVIREQDGVLRLLSVDSPKYWAGHLAGGSDRGVAAGRKWEVEIGRAPVGLRDDPHRRIHAIHLASADGLIIAPTHLGRVAAVEEATGKRAWTYEYAPVDAKRFPTFAPEWVVVPPILAGDRYVYAPADFPELLCLNVPDGRKAWSAKKGEGLYPAVVGDQVLVIGEKAVRSLDLKDGAEKWKADLPGLPCGRGAVLADSYLVPVSEPKTWRGMIAVVDLKAGKVVEVLKPDKDEPIGNLVVHEDVLISQTLTEIAVFPIK